jgi:hypothetical protein
MSFAQPMRDAIYTLNPLVEGGNRVADLVDEYGWDVAKANPEVRRLLQVFGTEVGRKQFGENFWVQQAFDKIEGNKIVFSDVRFPNEILAIKRAGGIVVRIRRGPDPEWYESAVNYNRGPNGNMSWAYGRKHLEELGIHASETAWIGQPVDVEIANDSSIENLFLQLESVVKSQELDLPAANEHLLYAESVGS